MGIAKAVRQIGVSKQTYYRRRKQYGGMSWDQLKRLKELETENTRLRHAVSDLTLDKMILIEAARGNFSARPPPYPFDPFIVHKPVAVVQHSCDHSISIALELSRQRDDVIGQPIFVQQADRHPALRGTVLPQRAAGTSL